MAISKIISSSISDNTVVAADVGPNAITASELADDAVDTAAIADDAITGGKLANDVAITTTGTIDVSGGTLTTSTAQKQTISATAFASGTKMLFQQTAAPTGWTKSTSSNDVALRVVSGSVGSGGSVAFETAFASQTIPSHTLTESEMPAHKHTAVLYRAHGSANTSQFGNGNTGYYSTGSGGNMNNTGGGGSHGHGSLNLDVSYVDVIIATKD